MSGYTRQSAGQILNGQPVVAPPINAEFNLLEDAFDASTGHAHDGSAGNGPKINLATSISGYLPAVNGGTGTKNNPTAVVDPNTLDDGLIGYGPGSLWVNTAGSRIYLCLDGSTNAAVWVQVFYKSTTGHFLPQVTGTVDLGSDSLRFRDMFISRNGRVGNDFIVGGAATIAGTLGVTGAATFGSLTATTADINGGNVDNAPIGIAVASTVRGTTITALTGFVGDLTGNVAGNVTGNVTGNLTGNVAGNVTGNVTGDVASSGSSTFNNVTISGSLDMSSGTSATVTGLSVPVNPTDAATKQYVDDGLAALVDIAPAALNTLNELAAALNDDPAFATTITNLVGTKLSLAGGTMSGVINMASNKITNLGTPTVPGDATPKTYVDTADALKLDKAGGTMTGNIVLGGNKITTTADPVIAEDLARKAYVDSILGSATASATSASEALTYRNAAEGFKNDAAASASAAAAVETTLNSLYLGRKASAPIVDNNGDPLQVGAWYFNTTTGTIQVYDGVGPWHLGILDPAGFLASINNLSDLTNAATARTNLGLGTAAITASTDYATASQGTFADTAYGWGNHASAGYLTTIPIPDQATAEAGTNNATFMTPLRTAQAIAELASGGLTAVGIKTAAYTALPSENVLTDTTAGAFTITLPASPVFGTEIAITDVGGTWDTNNLTVARNGSTIEGAAEDLVCDIKNLKVVLVYTGVTWSLTAETGGYINETLGTAAVQDVEYFATADQGAKADTAFGWGNHASAGYSTVTGTETLTNKTLTAPTITGTVIEDVYALTGTTPALEPANGSIQTWTLTANSTPTDSIAAGEAITLMIDDGTTYTITWPTITWVNNAGAAPTLATTGYTVIALWKVSTTLYGALVGDGS